MRKRLKREHLWKVLGMGLFRKLNCIYNGQKVLVNSILPLVSEVGPRIRSVFKEVPPVLSCEGEWLARFHSTRSARLLTSSTHIRQSGQVGRTLSWVLESWFDLRIFSSVVLLHSLGKSLLGNGWGPSHFFQGWEKIIEVALGRDIKNIFFLNLEKESIHVLPVNSHSGR